jgi:sulfatase modifying factor 1
MTSHLTFEVASLYLVAAGFALVACGGGASGTGGTGGGGGGAPCAAPADCPQPENDCQLAACDAGACGLAPKAAGAICAQGAGTCDGNGQCNLCEPGFKACNGSTLLVCGDSGTFDDPITCSGDTPYCDPADPKCVGCFDTSQCVTPGMNPCLAVACLENACVTTLVPDGSACTVDGTLGTCFGGVCNECSEGQVRCKPGSGTVPQTCVGASWTDAVACGGGSVCQGGACVPGPPSCAAGGPGRSDCGSEQESCCVSHAIPSGSFWRSFDGLLYDDASAPAAVGSHRLDRYEVTVGRFRSFVDAWAAGWRPSEGAGKHVHLAQGAGLATSAGGEPGWSTAWSAVVPATKAAWDSVLTTSCGLATWTATPGGNERRPLNCATWYELHAFCIWDGGFLPSEAERNFAAAGGGEQRAYPWSVPATSTDLSCDRATYGVCGGMGVAKLTEVGSRPAGAGRWGHHDLAGNVAEWTLDVFASPYTPGACVDCAFLTPPGDRAVAGGAHSSGGPILLVAARGKGGPVVRSDGLGARCARTP